ncbi:MULTISPECIES: hypothetical protein [Mesorhizobium]|uniref:Uncharacterized protein n=1 Tax=Mesorhizobium denitrificans TaxID=2294114 RepID=A0A371XGI7_9HYPH|nr:MULTISPECIES: hypothetical protein [Mesorhizobium]RFC68164.1 hypothetical protein DY251_07770 [Mesorhizobium denitrificans]
MGSRRPKISDFYYLSQAHNAGQVAKVWCSCCRTTRFYRPYDLKEVFGDIPTTMVREKMRCEQCKQRYYTNVDFFIPRGEEALSIKFRRLVTIKYERRVIWQDE